MKATAAASPNIAFIKYWGNQDKALRIPVNGSISMTLAGLETRTSVRFADSLAADSLMIDQKIQTGGSLDRVCQHLDMFRDLAGIKMNAEVISHSNFPIGAGIASSASAFAALTLAVDKALDLNLSVQELSRYARRGSGSACRSIHGGFVEWVAGMDDETSFATELAASDHWDLVDVIVLVDKSQKKIGSTGGHSLAASSPIQAGRVEDADRRLSICRSALQEKNFSKLAGIIELDSNLMHAVMMTSTPSLLYWTPTTFAIMQAVQSWRNSGVHVCYTIDAGPNVHCICPAESSAEIVKRFEKLAGVQKTIVCPPGKAAHVCLDPLE